MKQSFKSSKTKLTCLYNSLLHLLRVLILQVHPFWIELSYFLILSIIGCIALKVSNPKNASFHPTDFDIFFMSVSAATVSSISTVEMEAFSNAQLILLTILMFAGGEVFTSFLGLHLMKFKYSHNQSNENIMDSCDKDSDHLKSIPADTVDQIELGVVLERQQLKDEQRRKNLVGQESLRNCIQLLAYVVLCYLLVVQLFGYTLISIYISIVPSAGEVLKKKGINLLTFSAFATVSSFANCGFLPTNENMMVFKKNSGFLLILIPQLLLGNTLYPLCLRFFIWILQNMTKRAEFTFMLNNSRALGYSHLLSGVHSIFLAITVLGFIILQFLLFCILEWESDSTAGLSFSQKLVGSLFQVVNSRHAGESVFDLSLISPAMVVLFVLMMYLPPYTSLVPVDEDANSASTTKVKIGTQRKNIVDSLLISQPTYLVIFVILICVSERDKMKEDPLNFNLLSIAVEVMGNKVEAKPKKEIVFEESVEDNISQMMKKGGVPLGASCDNQAKEICKEEEPKELSQIEVIEIEATSWEEQFEATVPSLVEDPSLDEELPLEELIEDEQPPVE